MLLLAELIYGTCTEFFQSSETQSTGSSESIEVLAPSGFLQCSRACVNLEPCGSIQFNVLTLTCDMKAGIVLCPNGSPEMRCLSKADIYQVGVYFYNCSCCRCKHANLPFISTYQDLYTLYWTTFQQHSFSCLWEKHDFQGMLVYRTKQHWKVD